ncbi:methyl-accepting chemotaxis protein [Amorphus sp. 3PC139-8]|uniref:methyl-accepting chemotaxis protein n=1 Tax=Amorphus sp. 3PC139-8 TaxID=2735676 RepID=UPI00345D9AED
MSGEIKQDAGIARTSRKTSLRTRVALVVFAAVAFGFMCTTVLNYSNEAGRKQADLLVMHDQLTALLAGQLSGAVRFKKADAVAATADVLLSDVSMHAVYVAAIDTDGALIAAAGNAGKADVAKAVAGEALADSDGANRVDGAFHVTAAPVHFGADKQVIGSAVIVWDNSAAWAALRNRSFLNVGEALLIAIIVAFLIDFAMRRWMSRPIAGVLATMNKLASGDTAFALIGTERRDEIGDMARAVAVFRDNAIERQRLAADQERSQREQIARQERTDRLIADFRVQIQGLLGQIGVNMETMLSTASSLMSYAENATGGASGAALASRQASDNVQNVASASEELAASIGEIGRQVADTNEVVARASQGTRATNETISGLAEAAQKIGEVVELISDIAAQTNLLALNATIEAARAGEHGRGFAIVAAEVKTLASQTSKATEEISAQVGAIQTSTNDAVTAIQAISDIMEDVIGCTNAIAAAVGQQGQATGDITRNVAEAASGTRDAAERISGVTEVAGQTSQAAARVETASTSVAGQTEELRTVVDRFLKDVA